MNRLFSGGGADPQGDRGGDEGTGVKNALAVPGTEARSALREVKALLLTLALATGLLAPSPAGAVTEQDILFYAPYDGQLDAAQAAGDRTATAKGEFRFVEGKHGQGLLCGAEGTSLEYRTAGNISPIEGSLAVWVKPVGWSGEDSLFHIWFDTWGAGGRLLCYIYYAEHRNKLYVLGPEKQLSCANADASDWKDGEWHHLVGTWRQGEICLYRDGVLAEAVTDNVVLPSGFGDTFRVGTNAGWSFITGKADMVLDEFTIYRRCLLPDEAAGLYRGERFPTPDPLRIELAPYLQAGELGVRIDARGARAEGLEATVKITPPPTPSPKGAAVTAQIKAEDEVSVPLEGLGAGKYQVEVRLSADGKLLATRTGSFVIPERPPWWKNDIGREHEVLKPWTELDYEPSAVRCWGRRYAWRDTLLPSSIVSAREELLAAPMRLDWAVRDRLDPPQPTGFQYDATDPDRAVIATGATGGGLRLTAHTMLEYDGMARVQVELTPPADLPAPVLERLALRVPLRRAIATFYGMHSCPLSGRARAGAIPEEPVTSGFVPFVWLGDEERGLDWFCEGPENWRLSKPDQAIRIVSTPESRELQVTFIDKPTTIAQPLRFEFGLQATPVKPLPADWRTRRMAHWPEVLPGNILVAFWSSWSREPGYPIPKDPEAINRFCDEWHGKCVPYLTPYIDGTSTGTLSPEFQAYGKEWEVEPIETAAEQTPPRPMQTVCPNSGWADFLVWGVSKLMDDTKLDGLYFDITRPPPCRNAHHGCGYRDENGVWQPKYAIFAMREMFKRLYSVFQHKGRPLLLINHMSGAMTPPTLSFCDAYLDGEQFSATVKDDYLETVGLDEFRAEFMGRNYGLVPQFLPSFGRMDFNRLRDTDTRQTESVLALTLLHDTNIWAAWVNVPLVYKVWAAQDALPCRDAQFVGYWDNGELVASAPESIKVSAWRNGGRTLLCLVNMKKETQQAEVTLKLAGEYAASDPVWQRPVTFAQEKLSCEVEGHSFRLVRLDLVGK